MRSLRLVPAALACVPILLFSAAAAHGAPYQLPATGTLRVEPVTSSARRAPATPVGTRVLPLRVRNPQEYAQEKAAARSAYRNYAASHRLSASGRPGSSAFSGTAAVSIDLNQSGLNASLGGGATPPDTTGAIGPNFYIEFVNSRVAVYSRSTLASPPVATMSEDAFTGSTSTCDAQIKWDQQGGRWEYWSLDCGASSNGWSVGWSKTSDPTDLGAGGWCRYHVNSGSTLNDYGKLGGDDAFMIIGTNDFGSGGFSGSSVFALAKPALGSSTCPAASSLTLTHFSLPSSGFTPEPASIFGGSGSGFVVAINPLSMAALRLYRLDGSAGSIPTLTDDGDVSVPAFGVPDNVPQPSSTDVLDSSDGRLTQAVAVGDPGIGALGIWTQHTVAGPAGGPSVVRWYELRAGSSTPVQSGTIQAGGNFAFNAAISPTTAGNAAAVNYNVGGNAQLVQVRTQTRDASTSPGTMSGEATLATSAAADADFSCPNCRWGDYAGASPDPNNSSAVWGTNELNGPPDGFNDAQWQTQNFALSITSSNPSPPGPPGAVGGSAGPSGGGTSTTIPPVDVTAPLVSATQVLPATFRLGSLLAKFTRRAPVGTTISFKLSEPARATLTFSQPRAGRRVGKRCVAPTRSNARKPKCTIPNIRGTLTFNAHAGLNKIRFQGRLSRNQKLKLGGYRLTVTATDAARNTSPAKATSFTIVR